MTTETTTPNRIGPYHLTHDEAENAYNELRENYCIDTPRAASQCIDALMALDLIPEASNDWVCVHGDLGCHQDAVDAALYGA